MGMLQDSNEYLVELIEKYGLVEEAKSIEGYINNEKWFDIIENGSDEDFNTYLGEAIDPLTRRVFNLPGYPFVETLSNELRGWIKDTSILWVKNKGVGRAPDEYAATRHNDQMEMIMLINK